jgi:hypothetical protein
MLPACYFALEPAVSTARSTFSSAAVAGLPRQWLFRRLGPLRLPQPIQPVAKPAETLLQDFYILPIRRSNRWF